MTSMAPRGKVEVADDRREFEAKSSGTPSL